MDHLSDNELLARSATDPEAFGAFYDRHVAALIGALRYRTGSTEIALDIAGEVFAAVLECCDRFAPEDDHSARGLLYGIARNKLADLYRRGGVEDRARRRLGMEPITLSDRGLEMLEQRIDAERSGVMHALAELPDHEREAVSARVIDEDDYDEIAARLKVSESVVRQRVSRGLRRLRVRIREAT